MLRVFGDFIGVAGCAAMFIGVFCIAVVASIEWEGDGERPEKVMRYAPALIVAGLVLVIAGDMVRDF